MDKLSPELKDKYLKYKDKKDNKVKLGLYQDYELLFDLEDELGKSFMKEYEAGSFKKPLGLRNNSILAHGFNPIADDTYKEMFCEVYKLLKDTFPGTDTLLEKITFPIIKI